jgi:alkylation response protein AidB-like acyl-CoA dehydrogenase
MGYVEETGAAQHLRDARIAAIYEGTNGIQAIDLVARKVPLSNGMAVRSYIEELRGTVAAVNAANDPAFGSTGPRLADALDQLERTTQWLLMHIENELDTGLAGATPYLRLFGNAAGGCMLADEALAALRQPNGAPADAAGRIAIARFFAENIAVQAAGLAASVTDGAGALAPAAFDAAFNN